MIMSYGGYTGSFEYNEETKMFFGQLIGIIDIITFQGKSLDEVKISLKDSVEDYLEMCDEDGKLPDKPCFSLSLDPEVHSKVAQAAALAHKSPSSWIADVVENNLEKQNITSQ